MAGIPSRSIEAVCQNPTPAISFTASSVDNLSRISSILTLAKSEGGMDCVWTEYGGTPLCNSWSRLKSQINKEQERQLLTSFPLFHFNF